MNKEETYQYLRNHGVEFEITEHSAVYNMDELDDMNLPYPDWDAKNLFIRDDKKNNFYLITVRGDKRVDLKEFRKTHGTRPLSFASAEYLMEYLKLTAGSVTPLGILNDADCRVHFYLDREFLGSLIGVHPNDNTATIWLQTDDLIRILQDHGTDVHIADF